jgi:hypothetical protein
MGENAPTVGGHQHLGGGLCGGFRETGPNQGFDGKRMKILDGNAHG